MKKLHTLMYAFACLAITSCHQFDNGNISLSYSEDDEYYSMTAYFSKAQSRQVDNYLDDKIGRNSNMSFVNARIDGTIALDDHTKFYIKKYPGTLEIKLNKNANSPESYHEIKSMCQGIKNILAGKKS